VLLPGCLQSHRLCRLCRLCRNRRPPSRVRGRRGCESQPLPLALALLYARPVGFVSFVALLYARLAHAHDGAQRHLSAAAQDGAAQDGVRARDGGRTRPLLGLVSFVSSVSFVCAGGRLRCRCGRGDRLHGIGDVGAAHGRSEDSVVLLASALHQVIASDDLLMTSDRL
jgi:hypothetical protein